MNKQEYIQAQTLINNTPILKLLSNYGFYRHLLSVSDTMKTLDMNNTEIRNLVLLRLEEYYNNKLNGLTT